MGCIWDSRYRAGPEIGFVIENLDEVNARSVLKQAAEETSESVIGQSSSIVVSAPSSIKPQRLSPSVGSGVIPPAAKVSYDAPNTYQSNRYCLLQIIKIHLLLTKLGYFA